MNKKGVSFSGWLEVIILSLAIVLAFGFILQGNNGMNSIHGGNYSLGLGTTETINTLQNMQDQVQAKTQGGEVTFLGGLGMTLSTAWDMTLGMTSLIWGFITGGWLEIILTGYLHIPAIITMLIRILFFISIIFVLYKIIFRVNT